MLGVPDLESNDVVPRQAVQERGVELRASRVGQRPEDVLEIARAEYRPNTDVGRDLRGANRVPEGPIPQRTLQDLADDHTQECDQREKADVAQQLPHVFLLGRLPRRDRTNNVVAEGPVVA